MKQDLEAEQQSNQLKDLEKDPALCASQHKFSMLKHIAQHFLSRGQCYGGKKKQKKGNVFFFTSLPS